MRSIRISFVALAAALAAAPAAAQEEVVLLTASNGLPGDEFAFDLDLEIEQIEAALRFEAALRDQLLAKHVFAQ